MASATDGVFVDRTEISWDPHPGATRYYIYRNTTNNSASAAYKGNVTTNVFVDISGNVDEVYY